MNPVRQISTLSLVLLALFALACNSSDFAGDSRRKAKEPAVSTPVKPGTPGTGSDGDAGDDGDDTPGDDGTTAGDDGDDTPGDDGQNDSDDGQTDSDDGVVDNPPVEIDDGEVAALAHPCTTDAVQSYQITGAGSRAKVSGEICPRAFGKLTVTFVVDFSGSMEKADPSTILNLFSCGRAKAANRILDRIKKDMRDGDDVQVAFVSFGNDARIESRPKPIKDFSANILNFCGHNQGATNYKRAFEETKNALNGATEGNHVIYFISDGLPTTGGAGPTDNDDAGGVHKAAGLQAAQALKLAIEKATLNAIFLDAGGAGGTARTYLEQITGNAAQVKVASQASQLADQIVALSIPKVELKPATVVAELTAPNFPAKAVKLELFEKNAAKPGAWSFRTETIQLNKVAGATVENTLKIKAQDERGTFYEELMIIKTK